MSNSSYTNPKPLPSTLIVLSLKSPLFLSSRHASFRILIYPFLERIKSITDRIIAPQKAIPANGIVIENTRQVTSVLVVNMEITKIIIAIAKIPHKTAIAFFKRILLLFVLLLPLKSFINILVSFSFSTSTNHLQRKRKVFFQSGYIKPKCCSHTLISWILKVYIIYFGYRKTFSTFIPHKSPKNGACRKQFSPYAPILDLRTFFCRNRA